MVWVWVEEISRTEVEPNQVLGERDDSELRITKKKKKEEKV